MRVAERDNFSRQRYLMPPQLWLRLHKEIDEDKDDGPLSLFIISLPTRQLYLVVALKITVTHVATYSYTTAA